MSKQARRSVDTTLHLFILAAVLFAGCGRLPDDRGPTEVIVPTLVPSETRVPHQSPTETAVPPQVATPTRPATPENTVEPLPEVACAELGTSWAGGTATVLEGGRRYDVSGCARPRVSRAEMVKPAERDSALWADARCNDGTPFGFALQLSPSGQSREWIIFLEGGGFCDDNVLTCQGRGEQKSSSPLAADGEYVDIKSGGIFNRDPSRNPTFHDANVAFGYYCSSDAWTGASTQRRPTRGDPANGWYFAGRTNVRAMVEILIQRYGLDDADPQTKVLFAGSSSGGMGVDANADGVAALLPEAAASDRLKLLKDGSFFIDFDDPAHRPGDSSQPLREVIRTAARLWGGQHNALCEAAQRQAGQDPSRCYFSAVVYPFLTREPPEGLGLPLFVQVSSLDKFSLALHHIDKPKDPADKAAIELWRATALEATNDVAWLFSGGQKPYHTLLSRDDEKDGWNLGPKGETFREMLARFWEGGPQERTVFGNP